MPRLDYSSGAREIKSQMRWYGCHLLAAMGPGAREALPQLLLACDDQDQRVPSAALEATAKVAPDDLEVRAAIDRAAVVEERGLLISVGYPQHNLG